MDSINVHEDSSSAQEWLQTFAARHRTVRRQPLSAGSIGHGLPQASFALLTTGTRVRQRNRRWTIGTTTAVCGSAGEDNAPSDLVQHVSMKTVVSKLKKCETVSAFLRDWLARCSKAACLSDWCAKLTVPRRKSGEPLCCDAVKRAYR